MRRDRTTTARRALRLAAVGFVVGFGLTPAVGGRVEAVDATGVASVSPDPTEPPADEPPEEPTAPEDGTAPGDDTASDDEPAPEPGDVPAAVWVGAILLLVIAVVWAVRQSSKTSSSADD